MWRLLLFSSIFYVAHCSCPDGFDLVRDGQCRGRHAKAVPQTPDQAVALTIAKCAEIQSTPIIIHSEEQNSYWKDWYRTNNQTWNGNGWVIGLTCNETSTQWKWVDGSVVDYNKYLNMACNKDCFWSMYDNGSWDMWCGDFTATPDIFCQKQLEQPVPTACNGFEDDTDDRVCYQVGEAAETWQDAQMSCKKVGADVASIHNSQENSFIRRLAVSKGAVNGLVLGASVSGKGNDFGWLDGSDWDYSNFYPGFPMSGYGECLAMDTSSSAGQWMNRDCSSKLPVACSRKESFTVPEPSCSNGQWQENDIITSPGYPFSASLPCEYFLNVEKGQVVQAEILSLEANSCCDRLIIYDDYLGGNVIANLTGAVNNVVFTTNTNFMRVSWQPNGGVNVMGLAMVFRGV